MAENLIYGLVNDDNVYVHYKRQHFYWHKNNGPDYDFSKVGDQYVILNRQRYQMLAQETRPSKLENIKSNEKRTQDIFRAIATFSEDNIEANLQLITNEVQKITSSLASESENPYSLQQNIVRVQLCLDKIEEVVLFIEELSEDLLNYLLQDKQEKSAMKGIKENDTFFIIKRNEIEAFHELRKRISLLKGILKTKQDNKKISFMLSSLAERVRTVIENIMYSIAHYVAQEKIKEVEKEGKSNNVKISIKTYPTIKIASFKTDDVAIAYRMSDNTGRMSFNIVYGNPKDEDRYTFKLFQDTVMNIGKYFGKLDWQARYLMYNSILAGSPVNRKIYLRYATSFAVEDIVRNVAGNDYIFFKTQDDNIIPLSTFFLTIATWRTAQPIFDCTRKSVKGYNKWVGKGNGENVNDDLDEYRPTMAWIRARHLNDAFLNLRGKILFPKGKEKSQKSSGNES